MSGASVCINSEDGGWGLGVGMLGGSRYCDIYVFAFGAYVYVIFSICKKEI